MRFSVSKWRIVLFLWIIAGVIGFLNYEDVIAHFKTPIDLNQVQQVNDLKKLDHVTMDVTASLGSAVVEISTQKNKYTGKEISSRESGRFYLVPVLKEDEEGAWIDSVYMIKARYGDFAAFEKATDGFFNWVDDENAEYPTEVVYSLDGRVKPMSQQHDDYLTEYLEELGLERSVVGTYYIEPIRDTQYLMIMGGVAIGAFVIGLLVALLWRKNKNI